MPANGGSCSGDRRIIGATIFKSRPCGGADNCEADSIDRFRVAIIAAHQPGQPVA